MHLRHLLQHGAGDGTQHRAAIVGGDVLEHLLHAGVGRDGSEHPDRLGADLRVAIVEHCFQYSVANVHVLGQIGSEAAQGLLTNVGVGIVAQGDHKGAAQAVIRRAIPGGAAAGYAASMGKQAKCGILHRGVERSASAGQQQGTDDGIVCGVRLDTAMCVNCRAFRAPMSYIQRSAGVLIASCSTSTWWPSDENCCGPVVVFRPGGSATSVD